MAQTEDTELRDLVMEALERNGSLAKIRALIRANVFLAFEEEYDSVKHNIALDKVLKSPEGVLSLSLVHEFLEFLSLKNTLFVYTSETRQNIEYKYEGQRMLAHKLNMYPDEAVTEPLLLTLLKNHMKTNLKKPYSHTESCSGDHLCRDDQNCTYIVHEDSCSSSHSATRSDNSVDKNQLHLRLPLDNSDTDTSSDSMRDKTCSEYIANDKIIIKDESEDDHKNDGLENSTSSDDNKIHPNEPVKSYTSVNGGNAITPLKLDASMMFAQYHLRTLSANNSSENSSYVDFKPFSPDDRKLLNSTGLPVVNIEEKKEVVQPERTVKEKDRKIDTISSATLSGATSIQSLVSSIKDFNLENEDKKLSTVSEDYSNDFSSSKISSQNKIGNDMLSPNSLHDVSEKFDVESPHKNSNSSRSSVSLSDVADLLEVSESKSPRNQKEENTVSDKTNGVKRVSPQKDKCQSDDSGDFSGSPVPSLSNLSLDFHSD